MFVQLLENGRSLEPIDQVAKRIALSDDLDDAIQALEGIEKKKREQAYGNSRGSQAMPMYRPCGKENDHNEICEIFDTACSSRPFDVETFKRGLDLSSQERLGVGKLAKDIQDKVGIKKTNRTANLEMATRMVRRHLYRMAYYKKNH